MTDAGKPQRQDRRVVPGLRLFAESIRSRLFQAPTQRASETLSPIDGRTERPCTVSAAIYAGRGIPKQSVVLFAGLRSGPLTSVGSDAVTRACCTSGAAIR